MAVPLLLVVFCRKMELIAEVVVLLFWKANWTAVLVAALTLASVKGVAVAAEKFPVKVVVPVEINPNGKEKVPLALNRLTSVSKPFCKMEKVKAP